MFQQQFASKEHRFLVQLHLKTHTAYVLLYTKLLFSIKLLSLPLLLVYYQYIDSPFYIQSLIDTFTYSDLQLPSIPKDNQSVALHKIISSVLPDQASRVLREHQMASVMMECGRRLLQEVYDAQLQMAVRKSGAV